MRESPVVESMLDAQQTLTTKPFRRLILAALTIAAILLGLVGMHALSAGSEGQDGHLSHAQMSSVSHSGAGGTLAEAAQIAPATFLASVGFVGHTSTDGCTGRCEMNCVLLGMVCALSLLLAIVGLFLRRIASPPMSMVRRLQRTLRINCSVLVLPTPPFLHALSVSRI